MSYLHIENLYKRQEILYFREAYALEKIHGTSAHITFCDNRVLFSSGGEEHSAFLALFDPIALVAAFRKLGHPHVVVYGEAYGGVQQAQAWRYGPTLRFVVFDVKIGDKWLFVPAAERTVTETLGLEFVHFTQVSTDLAALDAERDAPSVQAARNGVVGAQPREGVVLRPLVEMMLRSGERVIVKHKRDEERETATPRPVVDPSRLEVLADATRIAEEWVTPTRLEHVVSKLPGNFMLGRVREVIDAMIADVLREGAGEIVDSPEARKAIGRRTASLMFERKLPREC